MQDQGPAGAGRHHVDREVRAVGRDAAPEGLGAARLLRSERVRGALHRRRRRQEDQGVRGAQRALPRAGSLHRVAGRRARRDHHRHQHGGPRHRHSARRQCRHAHPPGTVRHRGLRDAHARSARRCDPHPGRTAEGDRARRRRPVRARHRAAREPPHRQPVARPFRPSGRSRAARSSSSRWKTT